VPEDDRSRRRLGDATKARIEDLAEGWTPAPEVVSPTPDGTPPVEPLPDPPPRAKQKTLPPPPPGSPARKAIEEAAPPARDKPASLPPPNRNKPTSMPPPIATIAERAKERSGRATGSNTVPPPIPPDAADRSGRGTGPKSIPPPPTVFPPQADKPPMPAIPLPPLQITGSGSHGPATTIDAAPPALMPPTQEPPRPHRAAARPETLDDADVEALDDDDARASASSMLVPRGEFDDGFRTVDDAHRRAIEGQLTKRRDAAEALLKMPPPMPPPPAKPVVATSFVRGDPTALDPEFAQADASAARRGKLRPAAKLRRKRGLAGDVTYVFTALFGVRRTRRELADLEIRQQTRQASRGRHLVTLGRTAVIADALVHPALSEAAARLDGIEDERSQHAGQVAAADSDLDRIRRDRTEAQHRYAAAIAEVDAELADVAKRLEPLDKEVAVVGKRADALREALGRIDRQIAATEASLVSVKGPKAEFAAVQAELATLKADRKAVQRDEPVIAAELDTLNPRIAAIKGARAAAVERRAKLDRDEADDKRRIDELVEALKAKRKVVDRAVGDAEATRDRILLELGERLYLDRPSQLEAQLSPIDDIDAELGDAERRIDELREILSNVDRQKLARGAAVIALVVLAVAAVAVWVVMAAV
jgi:hypothetical protein